MAQEGNRSNGNREICLHFHRWGKCGYGANCSFVHTSGGTTYRPLQEFGYDQKDVEDGKDEYRESDAITIATGGDEVKDKSHSVNVEPKRPVDFRRKLKTRLCTNWKRDGICSFGSRCQFAHGKGELQCYGSSNPLGSSSSAGISAPVKNVASNEIGSSAPAERRFKWNGGRRINQVYGDWIE